MYNKTFFLRGNTYNKNIVKTFMYNKTFIFRGVPHKKVSQKEKEKERRIPHKNNICFFEQNYDRIVPLQFQFQFQ